MNLQKDWNLEHWATIAWSESFWNRPMIINKIYQIIDRYIFGKVDVYEDIEHLINFAKKELQQVNLPVLLYDRLIQTVISFELRIMHWFYSVKYNYEVYIACRCTKKFYWTVAGTINEAKIIENDWIELIKKLAKLEEIYFMACISVLKDYIILNAEKILEFCETQHSFRHKVDFIARSVFTLTNIEDLKLSEREKNELFFKYWGDFEGSKEAHMFFLSVKRGYFTAVQYYWYQLSDLEKEENLITAAFICSKKFKLNESLDNYKISEIDNYIDILVFLLKLMSEEQQREFFYSETFKKIGNRAWFLKYLICSSAWEDFFFPVFHLIKADVGKKPKFYRCLINGVIDTLHRRRAIGLDSNSTVFKKMFLVVWREVNLIKVRIEFNSIENSIPKIFEIFDFDIINKFLNKYSKFRQQVILKWESQYKKLMAKNHFDLLDKFMENILNSEDERQWFKSQLNYIYYFISKDKFKIADDLLNWLARSDDERRRIKYKFDFLSFCAKHFIKGTSTFFAEKALTWGLPTDEEKCEYINSRESKDLDWLDLFWSKGDDFISELSKFLNWFFNSKSEKVQYKIEKLLTENALRNFFFKVSCKKGEKGTVKCEASRVSLKKIDELIEFCLSSDNLNLKMDITENASKWLLLLADYRCWGRTDIFLNWILGYEMKSGDETGTIPETILDHKNKRDFVKKFLLSTDAVELFEKIFLCKTQYDNFKSYLLLWIEWVGDKKEIENYIEELGVSLSIKSIHKSRNFKNFKKSVFENLKAGKNSRKTVHHVCFNMAYPCKS